MPKAKQEASSEAEKMNKALEVEAPKPDDKTLIVLEPFVPSAAEFFGSEREHAKKLIEAVRKAALAEVPDGKTEEGRKRIYNLSRKVGSASNYIDGLGKDHVAELKKAASAVDAVRKYVRDELEILKAEVYKPRLIWEQKEAKRQASHRATIDAIDKLGQAEGTTEELQKKLDALDSCEPGEEMEEFLDAAGKAWEAAMKSLGDRLERQRAAEKQAADLAAAQAELARLKAEEEAEKLRKEGEARAAAAAKQKAEAELDAQRRKLESDRLALEQEKLEAAAALSHEPAAARGELPKRKGWAIPGKGFIDFARHVTFEEACKAMEDAERLIKEGYELTRPLSKQAYSSPAIRETNAAVEAKRKANSDALARLIDIISKAEYSELAAKKIVTLAATGQLGALRMVYDPVE